MEKPRLQKFIRGDAIDPLRLTPRDTALLRDVYEFRFLNSEQLLALHEGSRRGIVNRLNGLFRHGYLDRPEVQKTKHLLSSHLVYSLDRRGVDALSADVAVREGMFRRIHEVKHTSALIAHALMISQFRATLTLALKKYPSSPRLERWLQGYDLKYILASRGQSSDLVPDAFFTVNDGGDLLDFFLEADQSTMDEGRMLKKMKIYWEWWRTSCHEKRLGIRNFRVLTITKNETRAENLCRITKEADDRKTGSNMFLFLSEARYSLAEPEAVLSPIWASPKGERHAILE